MLVEHVTVKVPEFMESAVTGWFKIIESQFVLKGITKSDTKFLHLLTNLPAQVVAKLPETTLVGSNYEALKTAVLGAYEQTKPELLDKLMKSTTLTGRPSIFLSEMQTVASKAGVTDTIVRHRFIQSLPDSVRPVIAAQQDVPLAQLGKMADNLLPYFNSSPNVMNVTTPRNRSPSPAAKRTPDQNGIPPGLRPFSADQRPKVCRAHLYFADQARTCKPWCKWPTKTGCNIRPSSRPGSRSSSPSYQNSPN